jgi:hypothetical protein
MSDRVFLCHKCDGNLSKPDSRLIGCGCMSGWVRDWYVPVTVGEAIAEQAKSDRVYRDRSQPVTVNGGVR